MKFISFPLFFSALSLMAHQVNGGAYQDGFKEGERKARHLWQRDYKNNCDNIFLYTVEAKDDLYNGDYKSARTDNWRDQSFKKGGRDGVGSEVLHYQEDCISPVYCNELGQAAAEMIAADFCEVRSAFAARERSPVKFCREASTTKCKAAVVDVIKTYESCPEIDDDVQNLTRDQYYDLADECEEVVDDMIEWDDLKGRNDDKSTGESDSKSKNKKGKKKKKRHDHKRKLMRSAHE